MKSHESLIMVTKSQNISANFSVVFRDTKVVKYKVQSLKQTKEQSEAVAWVNIISTSFMKMFGRLLLQKLKEKN